MIISAPTEIPKVLDLLGKADTWTFDIETSGLNVRRDKIMGFSCASDAGSFYVILKAWNGAQIDELISYTDSLPIIRELAKKSLVTHNGSFDTRFIYHAYDSIELWPHITADTMLQAHCIDENRFNYGLKELGAELLGADSLAAKEAMAASVKSNGGSATEYYKASAQLLAEYGRQDAEMTWELYKRFDKQLRDQGLADFFESDYMELYREVTVNMELKGVPVDVPALEAARVEIQADMDKLENDIQSAIAPLLTNFHDWYISRHFPFEFSSDFKNKLGVKLAPPNWPKTASGGYSFAKVDLERAAKKGLLDLNCQFAKIGLQVEKPSAKLIREIQLELFAESGVKHAFNLLSTDHLKRLFFRASGAILNERALSYTPKGSPQINDEFLSAMATKYDWANSLSVYRSLSKLRGTYIDGVLERSEDGIFYPQFFQHRTTSGRYSGDAQQLPRIKTEEDEPNAVIRKHTNKVRNFFLSGPGHKLVDADYTSLEVVVFADDAQDQALLDIINNDYDFYSQVAIQVNKLSEYSADKKATNFLKLHKPELRQRAKAYALGIRYGEGSYKLHKELGCSQQEAERIIADYFKAFPKLKARMDELVQSALKTGRVISKGGRVRRLDDLKRLHEEHGNILADSLELWKEYHDSPRDYEVMKKKARIYKNLINNSLNFPVQSMAASIVTRASIAIMKEFRARGMKSYIALSVHDELCILAPDAEVPAVCEIMQRCMEQTTKLSVPLSAEPVVGTRYGEVK